MLTVTHMINSNLWADKNQKIRKKKLSINKEAYEMSIMFLIIPHIHGKIQ